MTQYHVKPQYLLQRTVVKLGKGYTEPGTQWSYYANSACCIINTMILRSVFDRDAAQELAVLWHPDFTQRNFAQRGSSTLLADKYYSSKRDLRAHHTESYREVRGFWKGQSEEPMAALKLERCSHCQIQCFS